MYLGSCCRKIAWRSLSRAALRGSRRGLASGKKRMTAAKKKANREKKESTSSSSSALSSSSSSLTSTGVRNGELDQIVATKGRGRKKKKNTQIISHSLSEVVRAMEYRWTDEYAQKADLGDQKSIFLMANFHLVGYGNAERSRHRAISWLMKASKSYKSAQELLSRVRFNSSENTSFETFEMLERGQSISVLLE
mmetsp:Transcript_14583/g.23171  ORF Transcript_14583/g.23171 Transcript_14583/m.23171 type:complete len:194 (+) Transcript_14583:2-583(+)